MGGNNYQIDQLATVVTKRHFGLSIPSVACDVLKARGCRVRLNPGWGGVINTMLEVDWGRFGNLYISPEEHNTSTPQSFVIVVYHH